MFKKVVLLVCLILSIPSQAEGTSGRTCRILFLAAPAGAPEKLFLFDGVASQEVELPRMNFSPVYKLRDGDLTLSLSKKAYATPEEFEPKAPIVKVPAAVTNFYLLISSDPENSVAPVKMQVVPADDSKLKKGEQLWFNLTANAVGGKIGNQNLAMKPQSRTVVKAPASGSEGYNVDLAYRIPGKDALYPLCETQWIHDPRSKTVVFVMNQGGSRTPRVMGFSDFREEEKKAEEQKAVSSSRK